MTRCERPNSPKTKSQLGDSAHEPCTRTSGGPCPATSKNSCVPLMSRLGMTTVPTARPRECSYGRLPLDTSDSVDHRADDARAQDRPLADNGPTTARYDDRCDVNKQLTRT